jgi:secreted trypsin-like serine protease
MTSTDKIFFSCSSFCNTTHMKASIILEKEIFKVIPQLFQDNLICAGDTEVKQGACEGDSGGPLLYKDVIARKYIQIATVEGGVGECGDLAYPGIFVRLNHHSIWKFISSILKKGKAAEKLTNKGKI